MKVRTYVFMYRKYANKNIMIHICYLMLACLSPFNTSRTYTCMYVRNCRYGTVRMHQLAAMLFLSGVCRQREKEHKGSAIIRYTALSFAHSPTYSLSHTHTHTHTHIDIYVYTHTLTLPPSFTHSHAHTLPHVLPYSHTHTLLDR